MPERITDQLVAVLVAFLSEPTRGWYGLELMTETRLRSGTMYPLLHRLVMDGWLERAGEAPSEDGGAERVLYKLTGLGVREADAIVARRHSRVARGSARAKLGLA